MGQRKKTIRTVAVGTLAVFACLWMMLMQVFTQAEPVRQAEAPATGVDTGLTQRPQADAEDSLPHTGLVPNAPQPASSRPASPAPSQVWPDEPEAPAITYTDYSVTPAYANVQPWQRAYFEALAGLFTEGNGRLPYMIRLWHGETPIMMVYLFDKQDSTTVQLWRMVDGNAQHYYTEAITNARDFSARIDPETGHPLCYVTLEHADQAVWDMYTAYDLDPDSGYKTELYTSITYLEPEPGNEVLRLPDGRSLTLEQMIKTCIPTLYTHTRADSTFTFLERGRSDRQSILNAYDDAANYLLDVYQPDLPQEAPGWVATYLSYLQKYWWMQYEDSYTGRRWRDNYNEILFYRPFYEGGAPVIRTASVTSAYSSFHFIEQGQVGFLDVPHLECIYRPMLDAHGNPLFEFSAFGGVNIQHTYYALGPNGLTELFGTNYALYSSSTFALAGSALVWLETEEEREQWIEAQTAQQLAAHGYGAPLVEQPGTSYTLLVPQSWDELEAQLIDIFCDYAKSIGQWDAGL